MSAREKKEPNPAAIFLAKVIKLTSLHDFKSNKGSDLKVYLESEPDYLLAVLRCCVKHRIFYVFV
jgi:hypothetical protein